MEVTESENVSRCISMKLSINPWAVVAAEIDIRVTITSKLQRTGKMAVEDFSDFLGEAFAINSLASIMVIDPVTLYKKIFEHKISKININLFYVQTLQLH